jgi:radical SAM protein with 4Fe4S-binding SPASM domain
MAQDARLSSYQYYENLTNYIGGEDKFFSSNPLPRQLEIHLPGDGKVSCPMRCQHCQGMLFEKTLGSWEKTGLSLLENLKGQIPFHIYGGAYTEPIINPYLMSYLRATKKYGNTFGIHTSGVPLWKMQTTEGWIDQLVELGTSSDDYISFSLDAGSVESHIKGKGLKTDEFTSILRAIEYLSCSPRKLSVRVCYLLNKWNSSAEELESIITFMKKVKVDSIRFSIPYAPYNQSFDKVRSYKEKKETPLSEIYRARLEPFLSKSKDEKPYVLYVDPEQGYTDIELYDFNQCVYGYYQLTYAADGYVYKCSAVAAPDAAHLRLGEITDDLEKFKEMNQKNQDASFNCQEQCFKHGVRCNRMAVECNRRYRDHINGT